MFLGVVGQRVWPIDGFENKDAGNSGSKSSVQCASNGKDMIYQSVYNHQHTETRTTRCKESSSQPQHSTANMTNFALLANDPTEPCQPDTDATRTHAGGKSNQATSDTNMSTRASTYLSCPCFGTQIVFQKSSCGRPKRRKEAAVDNARPRCFSSLRQKHTFFLWHRSGAFTVQFTWLVRHPVTRENNGQHLGPR